jgi:hypothetical protein
LSLTELRQDGKKKPCLRLGANGSRYCSGLRPRDLQSAGPRVESLCAHQQSYRNQKLAGRTKIVRELLLFMFVPWSRPGARPPRRAQDVTLRNRQADHATRIPIAIGPRLARPMTLRRAGSPASSLRRASAVPKPFNPRPVFGCHSISHVSRGVAHGPFRNGTAEKVLSQHAGSLTLSDLLQENLRLPVR